MIKLTIQKAFNEQIKKEFYSSYLYLAMSAYCEGNNYPGFAKWLKIQAKEEMSHGLKFFEFVFERGGKVELEAIAKPPVEYKSLLEMFKQVFKHEMEISASIHKIFELAHDKEKDYASFPILHEFIKEQIEEEKNASEIVEQLKVCGDSKVSLMLMDKGMGKRE